MAASCQRKAPSHLPLDSPFCHFLVLELHKDGVLRIAPHIAYLLLQFLAYFDYFLLVVLDGVSGLMATTTAKGKAELATATRAYLEAFTMVPLVSMCVSKPFLDHLHLDLQIGKLFNVIRQRDSGHLDLSSGKAMLKVATQHTNVAFTFCHILDEQCVRVMADGAHGQLTPEEKHHENAYDDEEYGDTGVNPQQLRGAFMGVDGCLLEGISSHCAAEHIHWQYNEKGEGTENDHVVEKVPLTEQVIGHVNAAVPADDFRGNEQVVPQPKASPPKVIERRLVESKAPFLYLVVSAHQLPAIIALLQMAVRVIGVRPQFRRQVGIGMVKANANRGAKHASWSITVDELKPANVPVVVVWLAPVVKDT